MLLCYCHESNFMKNPRQYSCNVANSFSNSTNFMEEVPAKQAKGCRLVSLHLKDPWNVMGKNSLNQVREKTDSLRFYRVRVQYQVTVTGNWNILSLYYQRCYNSWFSSCPSSSFSASLRDQFLFTSSAPSTPSPWWSHPLLWFQVAPQYQRCQICILSSRPVYPVVCSTFLRGLSDITSSKCPHGIPSPWKPASNLILPISVNS